MGDHLYIFGSVGKNHWDVFYFVGDPDAPNTLGLPVPEGDVDLGAASGFLKLLLTA